MTTQAGTGSAFALASTDFVFVNKPTQQAGIGVSNARVSGTTVGVTFSNFTSATATPTAGEKYGIVAVRGLPFVTQTITPVSVAASTTVEQLFTVPGIAVGSVVAAMAPSAVTNISTAGVRVAGPNQVGITFANASLTTATSPPSGQWTFWSTCGLGSAMNTVNIQANVGATTALTGSSTSTASVTVTGLATSDSVVGLSKPTAQAGISIGGATVTAANTLAITYNDFAAALTPTSYEVYGLTIFRPSPIAPIVTYNQALTPSAVPPNTTTSQLFTVTGIAASSMIWVNKPTQQPGLGIEGVRVTSTAGVIEITYANATAATITPTAGETYAIANFQQAVPDAGNTFQYTVTPQAAASAVLVDAVRSAMVSLGLIAGA